MSGRADSKVEKWLRWLEEPITNEVMTINLHRDTFQKVGEIAQDARLVLLGVPT
jgi:hypothetical protein